MVDFSDKQRAMLVKRGLAMPDGGYPIRNRKDLRNAIQAYGRGNNKDDVKRWIKRRAKQLDAEDMLPENWRTSMNHSEELYHFGVKGMKWGVRKKRDKPSKAQLNKPNADYTSRQRITDRASYGKKGVKRINRRMNKGQSHFRAATTEMISLAAKTSVASLAAGGLTVASTPEGRAIMKASVGTLKSAIGHSAPYMNYLRARYGAGYSWASPANEALKAIGNKIIVNTVTLK